jgi:hypothetical protein
MILLARENKSATRSPSHGVLKPSPLEVVWVEVVATKRGQHMYLIYVGCMMSLFPQGLSLPILYPNYIHKYMGRSFDCMVAGGWTVGNGETVPFVEVRKGKVPSFEGHVVFD